MFTRLIGFRAVFVFALILLMGSNQVFSQVIANDKMYAKEANFFSFSEDRRGSIDAWKKYNDSKYYTHPDFGVLSSNAPKGNVVEVLKKRTETSSYFVNVDNPSEFYVQQSFGPMHYQKDGVWLKIDNKLVPIGKNIYQSKFYLEPSGFDKNLRKSYILTKHGKVFFNDWSLYKKVNGEEVFIAKANWSIFRAGDDGVYIANIFDGIDAEMTVHDGAIKTNFIMKKNAFGTYESLIFRDNFSSKSTKDIKASFKDFPAQKEGGGEVLIKKGVQEVLLVNEGVAYVREEDKDKLINLSYAVKENVLDVIVPFTWINSNIEKGHLIIDPLVTGTNTLAQATITGSMYNSSCNFTNSCNYNMNVTFPANATIIDVTSYFIYSASGSCWLEDGATRFSSGSCLSPNLSGYYWFCNSVGGGTCTMDDISLFGELEGCMPSPSCSPQTIPFTMQFFRRCYGNSGCNNSCIGAASPWTMTVTGKTVEFNNLTTPITVSSTSVCQEEFVTTSALLNYGVPNYTYVWTSTGTPSSASGSNASFSFANTGTQTISLTGTDACGQTVNSSVSITVKEADEPTFNPIGPICEGNSFSLPTTSTDGITGTWTPAPNSNATTTYTFKPNPGQCAKETIMEVQITPKPSPPPVECYEVATWNSATCQYDISGSQPSVPTIECYETATWNNTTCQYDISGSQPAAPSVACYETATWNNATCQYDVTGTPPPPPTIECYETTTWNNATCQYDVTGSQPSAPTIECYETATWNNATCQYDITGSIPAAPSVACYETATWNNATCQYDVTGTPPPPPTFGNISPICPNGTFTLPQTSNEGISGTWSPAPNYTVTTTYTFTPASGECSVPTTLTVEVNPAPVATATPATQTICSGATTAINLSADVSGTTYTWTAQASSGVAGASNGSGASINQTLTSLAGGTVTYTITPKSGNCDGTPITVTINVSPMPTVVATPATSEVCAGSSVPLSAAGAVSYTWTPTLGLNTTSGASVTATPPVTTTYVVTGTDANGCSGTSQAVVNVKPIPTVVASPDVEVCLGQATILTATGANAYTWTPATGLSGTTGDNISAQPTQTTTYYVAGTLNGCSSMDSVKVTVNPLPIVKGGGDQYVCKGTPVILQGSGAVTYTWNNGVVDGTAFVADTTTTYTVS